VPALLAALALLPALASAQERPNVVLLVADDLDPTHLGFTGNALARTPNLDRLAAEGVYFPTLAVEPVCRPSLAVLLSGRWPHRTGIVHNQHERALDPAGVLPALLGARGYATFCGGKFWEGAHADYGFTAPAARDETFARNKDVGQDELFRWLAEVKDRPWFVWWAPVLPHVPHRPLARFAKPFEDVEIPVPEGYVGDVERMREDERALYGMDAWLDAEVGRLLRKLEELGERDETVILFLSDNGWSSAFPAKGTPRELGVRSPLVVNGPEIAPRRVEALVDLVDVHATVLALAGIELPPDRPGQSLMPWLTGGTGPSREFLCGAVYRRSGTGSPEELLLALHARDARWKLELPLTDVDPLEVTPGAVASMPWRAKAGEAALHDLTTDPAARTNLATDPAHAERLVALETAARQWWKLNAGSLPARER
jgi:uncharacterized sulfatase